MNEPNYKPTEPEEKKENKPGIAHRVGDAIEKVGDKIEHKGFKKTGDAIEKLGDKIEHSQDDKEEENTTKH